LIFVITPFTTVPEVTDGSRATAKKGKNASTVIPEFTFI